MTPVDGVRGRSGHRRQLPVGVGAAGLRGQPAGRGGRARWWWSTTAIAGGPSDQAAEAALRDAGLPVTWVAAGANLGYGQAVNLGRPRRAAPATCWSATPTSWSAPGPSPLSPRCWPSDPAAGDRRAPAQKSRRERLPVGPDLSVARRRRRPRAARAGQAGQPVLPPLPAARLGPRRAPRAWTGCRAPSSSSGGRRGTGLGGFDPGTSCTWRTSTCAGGPGRQGWRVVYEPDGEVVHAQGVSADTRPYRMILAHHRSLLTFAWRTGRGWERALFPLVAAGGDGRVRPCRLRRQMARRSNAAGERSRTARVVG